MSYDLRLVSFGEPRRSGRAASVDGRRVPLLHEECLGGQWPHRPTVVSGGTHDADPDGGLDLVKR